MCRSAVRYVSSVEASGVEASGVEARRVRVSLLPCGRRRVAAVQLHSVQLQTRSNAQHQGGQPSQTQRSSPFAKLQRARYAPDACVPANQFSSGFERCTLT